MNREYYKLDQLLVGGSNLVSDHLSWIIRGAVLSVCPVGGVLSIVCNPDLPKGTWGGFYGATRSIAINLEQHFEGVREMVQEAENMNTSIRLLLFMELINTAMHEAWHAKVCEEVKDFSVSDLDEQGASNNAAKQSWLIGKSMDVNITSFGPLLDGLIKEFYDTLKEDVEEPDCKEWKKLQLHMLENNLSFYAAETGTEIRTFREAIESYVNPSQPWMTEDNSLFNSWHGEKVLINLRDQEAPKAEAVIEPVVVAPVVTPVVAPIVAAAEPVVATAATPPPIPVVPSMVQYASQEEDCNVEQFNPFNDDEEVAPVMHTAPQAPQTQAPVNGMSVLAVAQIGEMVMRRMFHHVFTKCGFNRGKFTTPEAVLEPICINDIPGATEIFVTQDTHDASGVFKTNIPVNGFIKGTLSKGGLPEYKFSMSIAGQLHKRTFIVQNSEKTKEDGTLTKWAMEAQEGWLTMMLYAKMGEHATAFIRLPPFGTLGQETFSLWAK